MCPPTKLEMHHYAQGYKQTLEHVHTFMCFCEVHSVNTEELTNTRLMEHLFLFIEAWTNFAA